MRYSRSNTVEQVRKQWQKSPNQETVYGDRGHLKVLFNTKWVLNTLFNHLGSIWYHSEPTFQTSFLVRTCFAVSYSKQALANLSFFEIIFLADLSIYTKKFS